jgi:hypothetical protein
MAIYTYNLSYLRNRDREDGGSGPAQTKKKKKIRPPSQSINQVW